MALRRDIQYREAPMAESNEAVIADPDSLVVRPAVRERSCHSLQRRHTYSLPCKDASYAAHRARVPLML
jgi:hypothetical protein